MPKWWHVSGKRLGKAFLIVFLTPLLLGILAILVKLQLAPWRSARISAYHRSRNQSGARRPA